MGFLEGSVIGGEELEQEGRRGYLRCSVRKAAGSYMHPERYRESNIYLFEAPIRHVSNSGRETRRERGRKGSKVAFEPAQGSGYDHFVEGKCFIRGCCDDYGRVGGGGNGGGNGCDFG